MSNDTDQGIHSKNADIEVLRAVAVIYTLGCHINHLFALDDPRNAVLAQFAFWGGVDLFFCISGFVIATSILKQPRPQTFAELGIPFWIRRTFRIWPAAILWLGIPLLCAKFFNLAGAFGQLRSNLLGAGAAFLQIENVYFIVCKNHTALAWPCGKADVYWSLSLEEQFYLVFPFMVYFLRRNTLVTLLIALVAVQCALPRSVDSPLWFIRTDAISLGVLIAFAQGARHMRTAQRALREHPRLGRFAALMLLAAVAFVSVTPRLYVNAGLLAFVSAGLVVIASADANLIIPWRSLRPALLWAGSRSFAIYLVHNPAIWATREIFYRTSYGNDVPSWVGWSMIATTVVLVVVLSETTFRLVEQPCRNFGRLLAKQRPSRTLRAVVPST